MQRSRAVTENECKLRKITNEMGYNVVLFPVSSGVYAHFQLQLLIVAYQINSAYVSLAG